MKGKELTIFQIGILLQAVVEMSENDVLVVEADGMNGEDQGNSIRLVGLR